MYNGLGNNERKIFLGIYMGKITCRSSRDAERETYDFVEGELTGITRHDANINGKDISFYDFAIKNRGDKYVLSVPMDGSVARGIILPLANIPTFSGVLLRISPWLKNDYTNISVYAHGQKVNWVVEPKELPALEEVVTKGGKKFVDDSARMDFINDLVDQINKRLAAEANASPSPAPVVDYEEPQAPTSGGYFDDGLSNGRGLVNTREFPD